MADPARLQNSVAETRMKKAFKVGPYELGRELGKGATGTVYEGIDHLNDVTLAMKAIKSSQNSKRALLHEIQVIENGGWEIHYG